ncbi:hypothetical protein ACFQZO_14250 [Bradyrhizobium sp. GCM10027634]|uniref:hypothetical protein n=1 Tax=unclassified Bradyrhizobium TaxID=2631580 RepID=UPI00188BDD64|nr:MULTISPECIES: hypothetical protein [unclassified Bradyrhizobium]MDN5002050.1 hypothetical protein [Bradyrhizobium sp. WYCCWR 12677]
MSPDLSRLDLLIPALMYLVMIWWVGRRLSWIAKLAIIGVTLALIAIVVTVERAWH